MIAENGTGSASRAIEKTRPAARRFVPPVDIYEHPEGFLIVADLPGVEAEDLSIEYNPPELAVTAPRAEPGESGVFERRFELGSGIEPSTIAAELKAGVLRIELKKSAAVRSRRITVQAP